MAANPQQVFYPIYQGNTQDMKLFGLQDIDTGTFWNAAVATGTLYDANGNAVSGCTGVSLIYQNGTNGNYVGTFGDANFMPPLGTEYTLQLDADQGAAHFRVRLPARVLERTGN